MLLAIYNCIITPVNVAFQPAVMETIYFLILNLIIDITFLSDIVVNFKEKTGVTYTYISDAGYSWNIIGDPENNDRSSEIPNTPLKGFSEILKLINVTDDATVIRNGTIIIVLYDILTLRLLRVGDWLLANRLSLYIDKTSYMIVTKGEGIGVIR